MAKLPASEPRRRKPTPPDGSDSAQRTAGNDRKSGGISMFCIVLPGLIMGCAVALWSSYPSLFTSIQSLNHIQVPLDAPRVMTNGSSFSPEFSKERLWGSYRPQVYFGMRPRLPKSIVTGLMWYPYMPGSQGWRSIRHLAQQDDNLLHYGWLKHDGQAFGSQEVAEEDFTLTTEFVKQAGGEHGGHWSARISAKPRKKVKTSKSKQQKDQIALFFYAFNEGDGEMSPIVEPARTRLGSPKMTEIRGATPELGEFTISLPAAASTGKDHYVSHAPKLEKLHDFVMDKMMRGGRKLDEVTWTDCLMTLFATEGSITECIGKLFPPKPNVIIQQAMFDLPFQADITFKSHSDRNGAPPAGSDLTKALKAHHKAFNTRFEKTFDLAAKKYSAAEINFARAALSNMLGGMGYFYGASSVTSSDLSTPVEYMTRPLFTAVPSRSFFPRGFLWDEGFHQLLISRWDPLIAKESIGHWFDLINQDGWIPREQILGPEALSRVPAEFVVQHNENANPPTFFLSIQSLLRNDQVDKEFLQHLYPRLSKWFEWFNVTQAGPVPLSYRWRGRNATTDMELNPKTLTSGLDDFPRSSHPTEDERHVDLRCWMALAAGIMANISTVIGEPSEAYQKLHVDLSANDMLNKLHWCEKHRSYCDYGKHVSQTKLIWQRETLPDSGKQRSNRTPRVVRKMVRKVTGAPKNKFVPVFGYVNLFPLILEILEPSSPQLGVILDRLNNTKLLWTSFGLRSVARNDSFYLADNTEHDKPYWRGAIWININYLCVRSLHHYGQMKGPHQRKARALYRLLRKNLISNIFKQYQQTGFIWEQYDDLTGQGKGTRPFTGWSALVVLLMSELY
ncbi:mannosyl-oligosaccharide glucosidase-like [Sycon ciliatum]|uniref:mannosyl-oligosaccharide glucosidase-like n=1 Tax=Sycon ciliatum TaxID=27933 RepID=UPI0020A8B7D5|eukprot:scpid11494/ scgid10176/ Mannosyl-oligosaccharide glucosidase; Processing A-glucosidase I